MTPEDTCPACKARRVDRGSASALEYAAGTWIGCTSCGFSLSGPDEAIVEAAWRSIRRSTAVSALCQDAKDEPEAFPF
jgi:ribosomal protein L37AE/L43A